jgi:hypothetical protein
MQQLRNLILACGAFAALVAIGIMMNPTKAAGQGPVNGLNVNVVGPLPIPVQTVSSAFEPVYAKDTCVATAPGFGCSAEIYTVPAGKRLVVEYFSVLANLTSAGESARVHLKGNSTGQQHFLPLLPPSLQPVALNFASATSGGQAIRMYFAPQEVVSGDAIRGGPVSGTATFSFQITGHLIKATP